MVVMELFRAGCLGQGSWAPEMGGKMPPTCKPPYCLPWATRLPQALAQFGKTHRQGTTARQQQLKGQGGDIPAGTVSP